MTEKSTEGGTFPENRHIAVFEFIRHENVQKGRNEGRTKTIKKDKQKSWKPNMSLFFMAPSARNHCFYSVFGATRKSAMKKAKFVTFTKTPSQKKNAKKRHICALFEGSENTIFVVVSRVYETGVLLSSHEMTKMGFF